ncbi:unnamed protein product, partial [marine sediment metagenome]
MSEASLAGEAKGSYKTMSQKNKKLILACLFLIGVILPLCRAYAGFPEVVAATVANYVIGMPFKLFLGISNLAVGLSSAVLDWVSSEWFINWNYTGLPMTDDSEIEQNPIVQVGWTLTRDLINMFFVIVLAFIGLATALRIEQYKYEKLLPIFIGIALIINFSPVICGLFIDASNIIM